MSKENPIIKIRFRIMKYCKYFLLLFLPVLGCSKKNDTEQPAPSSSMYFPPNDSNIWETESMAKLGWNQSAVQPLKEYLEQARTKSFMILVNGRIVMEEYFNGHTADDDWEWNSAGKTLVASTTGIAQQEGLLNINDKVSKYLGTGWSSEPLEKENLITLRNLLTMTSGLNDEKDLVIKSNLTYLADAGTRWSYSNVFQLLFDVVAKAGNQDFDTYFNNRIRDKIGMNGYWSHGIIFNIYHSTTRSMARFGLLALNNGKWKNDQIISEPFFKESISTSQDINPSYGYLWWLNGKTKYMVPRDETVYPGSMVPDAPSEMYAAMGAADQRIYIIPSKKMVVVRMGDASNPNAPTFAVSGFDNALWQKINALVTAR